jgi:hypothetical protein
VSSAPLDLNLGFTDQLRCRHTEGACQPKDHRESLTLLAPFQVAYRVRMQPTAEPQLVLRDTGLFTTPTEDNPKGLRFPVLITTLHQAMLMS